VQVPRLTIAAAATIVASVLLTGCQQDCEPNEISSQDHGCIEKDDLDLDEDGTFKNEEQKWDDD
jgi:outer membrane murein-binding lipoprotein Lpp